MSQGDEIHVYLGAGGLKVANPKVLFVSPYCIPGRCSPAFPHHNILLRVPISSVFVFLVLFVKP